MKKIIITTLLIFLVSANPLYAIRNHPGDNLPTLPDLVLGHEQGVSLYTYSKPTKQYRRTATLSKKGNFHVATLNNGKNIFAANEQSLWLLNQKLKPQKTKLFKSIGALATTPTHLLVAADGKLLVFTKDLKQVGVVDLKITSWETQKPKDAHDILVQGNDVYLLDNIVTPIYILHVNIQNIRKPVIKSSVVVNGIYLHLDAQWLDLKQGNWFVLQSGRSGYSGSYQGIAQYSLANPSDETKRSYYPLMEGFKDKEKSVRQLFAVTSGTPTWAVFKEGSEAYLANIAILKKNVEFTNKVPLPSLYLASSWKTVLRQWGSRLFILSGTNLEVMNTERSTPPTKVLSQQLESSKDQFFTDLAVLETNISNNAEKFLLKILTPNGGERWKMGDSEIIKWSISPKVSQDAYLDFILQRIGDSEVLWSSEGIEGSNINLGIHTENKLGYLGWNVLKPGTYTMEARLFDMAPCGEKPARDDSPCKKAKVIARDTSDALFTVYKDETAK